MHPKSKVKKKNQPSNDNDKEKNKTFNKKPDWMFREPEQNDLMKAKTWNNREWWFCGKKTGGQCEQYRQHKGKDCQGKSYFVNQKRKHSGDYGNKEQKDAPPKSKIKKEKEKEKEKAPKKPSKALKLSSALPNIVNEDDSSSDSD